MSNGFGFRQLADSRDLLHPLTVAPVKVSGSPLVVRWKPGPILQQGVEGACVGMACRQLVSSDPVRNTTGPNEWEIYREAQENDEWPDLEEGTSVRAGMEVLKRHGLIKSYKWAPNIETVADYVRSMGGLVAGTNWYSYETDFAGRMHFNGTVLAGHAWYISGVDVNERVFFCVNSWGTSFGKAGEFWVTFDDLARMMRLGGVVAAGRE